MTKMKSEIKIEALDYFKIIDNGIKKIVHVGQHRWFSRKDAMHLIKRDLAKKIDER